MRDLFIFFLKTKKISVCGTIHPAATYSSVCNRLNVLKRCLYAWEFKSQNSEVTQIHRQINQNNKKAKRNTICLICDETIKEPTKHRKGDEAIYCEKPGSTGLSNMNFTVLSNSGDDTTYFCLYCELQAQKAEIEHLMETITKLQTSLTELKRTMDLM